MFASPHPTELRKPLDPDRIVEDDRNLFCEHYICCLDEAVTRNWVSWTCAECLLLMKLRMVECSAPPM
jgi:hypothetical protein